MIQRLLLGICIFIYRTIKYVAKGFLFIISIPFQILFLLAKPSEKTATKTEAKSVASQKQKSKARLKMEAKQKKEAARMAAQIRKEQKKIQIEQEKNNRKQAKLEAARIKQQKKDEAAMARRQKEILKKEQEKVHKEQLALAKKEKKEAARMAERIRKEQKKIQIEQEKNNRKQAKLEAARIKQQKKVEAAMARHQKEILKKEQEKIRKEQLALAKKEKKEKKRALKIAKQEALKAKKEEKERLEREKRLQIKLQKEEKRAKKQAEKARIKAQKEFDKRAKNAELIAHEEEKRRIKENAQLEKKAKKEQLKQIKIKQQELKRQQKIERIREKNRLKEEKAAQKVHEKELKKQERLRKIQEQKDSKERKRQAKIEEKRAIQEARQKNREAYINKDARIEKPSTFKVLSDKLKRINQIPNKFGSVFSNNAFVKNARNRRDMNRQALLIDFEGDEAKKSDVKLVYEYEAKNKEGKFVKGYFEAYSRVEVHSFLLSEGYEVYSIKTNKWITLIHGGSDVNKVKFKNKDLIFFLAQLSTYLKAGITLVESLRILSRQFKKQKKYQKIFRSIIYELTMGENFSTALEKQNIAFPKLLINMVKTAEMTGELPEVLDDMVNYYTETEETRRQFITAMTYPSIVGVFALGVITFILMYVVPQFVSIYSSLDGAKIPAFTQVVMNVSFFLKKYIIWIILVIAVVVTFWILLYRKNRFFRTINQWVIMHIPAIGNTMIYSEVATFTKTFGSLLAHNVPIPECLEILNKITTNEIYKMMILDVVSNLAKGGKISDAFEGNWAFPVPAYEMICTGEVTGELPDMLAKVSAYYQSLEKTSVTRIKTFIEPILTVGLTVIVGIIILAIIIPMFNLYQSVQNMKV